MSINLSENGADFAFVRKEENIAFNFYLILLRDMRKKKPDCIIPKFYKFYYDVNILRESKKGRRKVGEVRYVDKFWN